MKTIWVLVAVALLGVGCGGGSNDGETPTVDDVLDAFNDVGSYRVEMYVNEPEGPLVYEFEEPDSWHAYYGAKDAQSGEVVGFGEALFVGEDSFMRRCKAIDEGCSAWTKQPRGDVIVAAISPSYLPQWPTIALELAEEESVSASGDEIVMVGSVNVMRAILENLRVLTEATGDSRYGTSCTSSVTPSEVNEQGTVIREGGTASEVCRNTTYEELLEQEADDIARGDEHPAAFTASIDAETLLLKSIEMRMSPRDEDDEATTLLFEYSRYNDVTVRAPE